MSEQPVSAPKGPDGHRDPKGWLYRGPRGPRPAPSRESREPRPGQPTSVQRVYELPEPWDSRANRGPRGSFPTSSRGPHESRSAGLPAKQLSTEEFHHKVLSNFKTQQCRTGGSHDRRLCQYWHSKLDRRRNPFEHVYSATECTSQTESTDCAAGDSCPNSHNLLEKMYHPDLCKVTMCQKDSMGLCERGAYCAFAHGPGDLRRVDKPEVEGSPLEKLVHLIKSAGPEGILGSDLPKRYQTYFGMSMDSVTEHGRLKIKDVLAEHDKVVVDMHKGAQPKYVYDVNAASIKAAKAAEADAESATRPATMEEVQQRLVSLVLTHGDDGVLGSDLPKKYKEVYNERIEVLDEAGAKLRLKDILVPHPDIKVEMYKQLQPRFYFEKGGNRNYQPSLKKESAAMPLDGKAAASPFASSVPATAPAPATGGAGWQPQGAASASTLPSPSPLPGLTNVTMKLRHALLGAAPGLSPPPSAPTAPAAAPSPSPSPSPVLLPQQLQGYPTRAFDFETGDSMAALQRLEEEHLQELNEILLHLTSIEKAMIQSEHRDELQKDATLNLLKLRVRIKDRIDERVTGPHAFAGGPTSVLDGKALMSMVAPPPAPTPAKPMCALTGCTLEGIYICTGCREAYYCGVVHQKQHWVQQHNSECNKH